MTVEDYEKKIKELELAIVAEVVILQDAETEIGRLEAVLEKYRAAPESLKVNKKNAVRHRRMLKVITKRHGSYLGSDCRIYTLVKVVGKSSTTEGKDQWGLYCCSAHLWAYKRHFNWPFARSWCWERYANHCGLCGAGLPEKPVDWRWRTLDMMHFEPLNAGFRDWTLLNRSENLILLCPACHNSTRTKDFVGIPKMKVDTNQLILI